MNFPNTADLPFHIHSLSEKAIILEFGDRIEETVLKKICQVNTILKSKPFTGMITTVPAHTSLTIFFEPERLMHAHELKGLDCVEKITHHLLKIGYEHYPDSTSHREIKIPVCYHPSMGLDLSYVANYVGLSIEKVVSMHCSARYTVCMVGFIPGFAYLSGMPAELSIPRKASPARSVAAGAIGLADQQTGIYPFQSPGGWQIIGQTPLQLFNANNNPPSLLRLGDSIQLVPIDIEDYEFYKQHAHTIH